MLHGVVMEQCSEQQPLQNMEEKLNSKFLEAGRNSEIKMQIKLL